MRGGGGLGEKEKGGCIRQGSERVRERLVVGRESMWETEGWVGWGGG